MKNKTTIPRQRGAGVMATILVSTSAVLTHPLTVQAKPHQEKSRFTQSKPQNLAEQVQIQQLRKRVVTLEHALAQLRQSKVETGSDARQARSSAGSKSLSPAAGIVRKQLATAAIEGQKSVERVEVMEIRFPPHQKAARHLHPCPVIGQIIQGTILFQIQGQAPQVLQQGQTFFEPANATIVHFDNPSAKPAAFIAFYLRGKEDHELIQVLPEAPQ